jgi:hypothetical protein
LHLVIFQEEIVLQNNMTSCEELYGSHSPGLEVVRGLILEAWKSDYQLATRVRAPVDGCGSLARTRIGDTAIKLARDNNFG